MCKKYETIFFTALIVASTIHVGMPFIHISACFSQKDKIHQSAVSHIISTQLSYKLSDDEDDVQYNINKPLKIYSFGMETNSKKNNQTNQSNYTNQHQFTSQSSNLQSQPSKSSAYLDMIFGTNIDVNKTITIVSRKKNRRNHKPPPQEWWSTYLTRRLAVIEMSMRQYSQMQSFSCINGTMAGDIGFDPLGVAINYERLDRMREIELKHARIAMIAALGWPLSELVQPDSFFTRLVQTIMYFFFGSLISGSGSDGDITAATATAASIHHASVVSGALFRVTDTGVFLVVTSALEYFAFLNRRSLNKKKREPGDFGMDPFNLYESRGSSPYAKRSIRASEIWNGRIAMVAILIYYVQERLTQLPVVDASPLFFHPLWNLVDLNWIGLDWIIQNNHNY